MSGITALRYQISEVSTAKIGSKTTTTNGHCLIWIISVLYSPPFPTYRKQNMITRQVQSQKRKRQWQGDL